MDKTQLTPDIFKQKVISANPNAVSSDGRKYSEIPATELLNKALEKNPNAVTKDGIKYSDFKQSLDVKSQSIADKTGFSETGVGKFGKGIFDFFTSATQALGQNAGQSIAAPENVQHYSDSLQSWSDINSNLQKAIESRKKAGADTSKLEKVMQEHNGVKPQLEDFVGVDTAQRMKEDFMTNLEEVAGQGVGTVLEAMTGGILQSGVKTLTSEGLSMGQKMAQGAKIGAGYGSASGASSAMQEKKGVGEVAVDTVAGAAVGAVTGAAAEGAGAVISKKIAQAGEKKATSAFENTAQKKLWSKIQPEIKDAAEAKATGRTVSEGKFKTEVMPNERDNNKLKLLDSITKPNMTKTEIATKASEEVNKIGEEMKTFVSKNDKTLNKGSLYKGMMDLMQSDKAREAVVFKGDASLEKAYTSMMNGFLDMTKGNTVKLSEILENKEKFLALARKYIPNTFSADAAETVQGVAMRDINNFAKQTLVDNIEGGKIISDNFDKQSLLLESINDIGKNTKVGQSKLYQSVKKILKFGAWTVGGYEAARGVGIALP